MLIKNAGKASPHVRLKEKRKAGGLGESGCRQIVPRGQRGAGSGDGRQKGVGFGAMIRTDYETRVASIGFPP